MRDDERSGRAPCEPARVPGLAVVRAMAPLVPRSLRDAWRAEWEGELHWRWTAGRRRDESATVLRLALVARCLGAIPDALWMRHHYGGGPMLSQDLRLALRAMRARPGFSAVVTLTLALGIGANAALFSVVNAVLLRQLPYRDPSRLVVLSGVPTDGDSTKVGRATSYPDYLDVRAGARSFASMAAMQYAEPTLTQPGLEPMLLHGAAVTASFLATLGVAPALGRGIAPEEDRKGGTPVVVLGHALWRRRFGGDPRVLGRSVRLDGVPHTVVGVMPRDFEYPRTAELWTALAQVSRTEFRGVHANAVVARLRADVTLATADVEVRTIARRLEAQYPESNARRSARLEPLREVMVQRSRPALLLLSGAVALVLLVACTNIASLFLARTASREREAAIRTALGAPRGRLVRQLLTESVLLALLGGALGLLVARAGVRALVAMAPERLLGGPASVRGAGVGIDGTVLVFLLAVSLLVGLVFGALPAWHFARGTALGALRLGARGGSGVGQARARRLLVVAEVALAVVLAVGAGLVAKSFVRLRDVDPGFAPRGLVAVSLQLPESRYPTHDQVRAFHDRLTERVAAIPGVRGAVIAYAHPLDEGWTSSFTIEGREPPKPGEEPEARVRPVGADYFRLAGVRLLAGRGIEARDGASAPGVVIINQSFARLHFPNEDPVGKRILRQPWWPGMPSSFEIVGVAADERFRGPEHAADPATYFSLPQFTFHANWLLVRSDADLASLAAAIRRQVWAIDRDLPVDDVRAMSDILADRTAAARFNAMLLLLFAMVALALSALGVYGVLSYSVARRTGEMGIRLALGAPRSRVVALVVGEGAVLALAGVVAGLLLAGLGAHAIEQLLFGVRPLDAQVFGLVAVLLTLVAWLAAWIPARRASRVDPLVAMRGE